MMLYVLLLISYLSLSSACRPLNKFLTCYELTQVTLTRDDDPQVTHIHFEAFQRLFHLAVRHTRRERRILSENFRVNLVSEDRQKRSVETPSIQEVSGIIVTEGTSVEGTILNNKYFYGSIDIHNDTFYLEPMSSYKPQSEGTIVYRHSDVSSWSIIERPDQQRQWRTPKKAYISILKQNTTIPPPRRSKRSSDYHPTRKLCSLHLFADDKFYSMRGFQSVSTTVSLLVKHLEMANDIFRRTDFNGDGLGDNIAFKVEQVTIFETPVAPDYKMSGMTDVDAYLDTFSEYDFDGLCLGLVFTHTDFVDGVIGLAWMASSSHYDGAGGMCQERVAYHSPPYYRAYHYSFNTLLVSTLNYDETLPTVVTALTLTHEFGHSFGSPHDEDPSCTPGGLSGNYIMHPYASDADRSNNYKFSSCSRSYINPVVLNKGSCLQLVSESVGVCGDGELDPGEECDCGDTLSCMLGDGCCLPAGPGGCTLASGHVCSPAVSACCVSSCELMPAGSTCSPETECQVEVRCDGVSAECAAPATLPDGSPCHHNSSICHQGECTHDLCLVQGVPQCQCRQEENFCELCCYVNGSCVTAASLELVAPSGEVLHRLAGKSCADYTGYCNQQHRCVRVDYDDVYTKLIQLFSEEMAQTALEWFQNYWYLCVIAVCIISLMVAIFRAYSTKHRRDPLNTLAIQSAKMVHVWQAAEQELKQIKHDRAELESSYERHVQLLHHHQPTDPGQAISRLSAMFPNTPHDVILKVLRCSTSEEYAIRQLLLKGSPMKNLHHKHHHTTKVDDHEATAKLTKLNSDGSNFQSSCELNT